MLEKMGSTRPMPSNAKAAVPRKSGKRSEKRWIAGIGEVAREAIVTFDSRKAAAERLGETLPDILADFRAHALRREAHDLLWQEQEAAREG